MKKTVSISLSVLLIVALLAGCGAEDAQKQRLHSFFGDAAFIGDSISLKLRNYSSEHDTFGESVLDAVNNGGEEMLGWCNNFILTNEKNFDERQRYFEESVLAVPRLSQWLKDFYQTAEKFDTNEYTERSDEGQD